jgi:hypothetical protein
MFVDSFPKFWSNFVASKKLIGLLLKTQSNFVAFQKLIYPFSRNRRII